MRRRDNIMTGGCDIRRIGLQCEAAAVILVEK